MKKLEKRYYILLLIFGVVAGILFKCTQEDSFRIIKDSTVYAPELDMVMAAKVDTNSTKININEADVYTLDKLPQIGEITAKRIIEYRTRYGNFEVIQDIMKVNGIGKKTFDEIKDYICVK